MKTITNNHWRNFLYGNELTDKEVEDFDWMDDPRLEDGFIRYRGATYHLSEFMSCNGHGSPFADKWHGYHSDSFFSAVVIQMSDDCEQYKIGLTLS